MMTMQDLTDYNFLPDHYVCLDMEFAELDNQRHQFPLEIAATIYHSKADPQRFHEFLYYPDIRPASFLRGLEASDQTVKLYKEKYPADEIVRRLIDFLPEEVPIVGWNVSHDLSILCATIEMLQLNDTLTQELSFINLDKLVSQLLELRRPIKMTAIGHFLGFSITEAHSADGDEQLTAQITQHLRKILPHDYPKNNNSDKLLEAIPNSSEDLSKQYSVNSLSSIPTSQTSEKNQSETIALSEKNLAFSKQVADFTQENSGNSLTTSKLTSSLDHSAGLTSATSSSVSTTHSASNLNTKAVESETRFQIRARTTNHSNFSSTSITAPQAIARSESTSVVSQAFSTVSLASPTSLSDSCRKNKVTATKNTPTKPKSKLAFDFLKKRPEKIILNDYQGQPHTVTLATKKAVWFFAPAPQTSSSFYRTQRAIMEHAENNWQLIIENKLSINTMLVIIENESALKTKKGLSASQHQHIIVLLKDLVAALSGHISSTKTSSAVNHSDLASKPATLTLLDIHQKQFHLPVQETITISFIGPKGTRSQNAIAIEQALVKRLTHILGHIKRSNKNPDLIVLDDETSIKNKGYLKLAHKTKKVPVMFLDSLNQTINSLKK